MAESKKNPKRAKKVEQFKETAKKEAAQQQIPRTHLIPYPTWQSTDILECRGDLLEAFEQQLVIAMDAMQKAGQALQYLMQWNIKNEKIKLQYQWNNGEKPTQEEIDLYLKEQARLMEERKNQMLNVQSDLQKQKNANETGLVTVNGAPLATDRVLDEEAQVPEDADETETSAE